MDQLVVMVHLLFRKGEGAAAIEAFRPAVEASQREEGCIKCALHRDVDDPDVLVLVERWASKEAHEKHLRQPHIQALNESVATLIAGVPRISIIEPIEIGDRDKTTV